MKCLRTGETKKIWFGADHEEIKLTADDLLVTYYAPAEIACLNVLGIRCTNILDMYVEFKNFTNGFALQSHGQLDALKYFGLAGISYDEKECFRQIAIRGGPFTADEREGLVKYCLSDVLGLEKLFFKMIENLSLAHALFRGRYMLVVAEMEARGIPIDVEKLVSFQNNLPKLKLMTAQKINQAIDVFDGTTFKLSKFEKIVYAKNLKWPRTLTGKLATDDDTFADMAKVDSDIALIREARSLLSKVKLSSLSVGKDGRNRCMLAPFGSITGRNQPSTSKFIFGLTAGLRGFIKPQLGMALAYVDFSQQEYGIAGALSGDLKMQDAYASGDPYLQFAKDAGLAPKSATKKSHREIREQAKQCILAVQYGMGKESLAVRLNKPVDVAGRLLELHRRTYSIFWAWSDQVEHMAFLQGKISTNLGWQLNTLRDFKKRSVRNFPMQANGSEILRVALILMSEAGLKCCAPIHDAILIEAETDQIEHRSLEAQELMAEASSIVLGGFRLRSDVKVVRYPERYEDERGFQFWNLLQESLAEIENGKVVAPALAL